MRKREKIMTHLKRILIVDDSDESRSILGLILHRSWGYDTIEAATGPEAVKKAISEKPDLIIMDLGLPEISGVDATKAIKENSTTAHIPIIAHTVWPADSCKEQALNAGMEKPVPIALMKTTIEKFIPH
jgi:two-component system, OmpR family, KDP operon response regulator KdpE